jgi:hypothetical protein
MKILTNFANSDANYSMHPLAKFCKHYAQEWRSQKSFATQTAITGRPFLVLGHTLPTTLSKLSLAASCKIGVQSEYYRCCNRFGKVTSCVDALHLIRTSMGDVDDERMS